MVTIDKFLVQFLEVLNLARFKRVCLNDTNTGQILLNFGVHHRNGFLDTFVMGMQSFSEKADQDSEYWIGKQRNKGQTCINTQHDNECKSEKYRRISSIHHGTAQHHSDGVQIACCARHQIAGADVIVIRGRKLLEMEKEVGTEVKLHLSCDPLDRVSLNEA